jgi:hypothetical protein
VKTPNLVQRQTGVYKFPPVTLPKMTTITPPARDPGLPSRIQQPAPQPVLNTPKAPTMNTARVMPRMAGKMPTTPAK